MTLSIRKDELLDLMLGFIICMIFILGIITSKCIINNWTFYISIQDLTQVKTFFKTFSQAKSFLKIQFNIFKMILEFVGSVIYLRNLKLILLTEAYFKLKEKTQNILASKEKQTFLWEKQKKNSTFLLSKLKVGVRFGDTFMWVRALCVMSKSYV